MTARGMRKMTVAMKVAVQALYLGIRWIWADSATVINGFEFKKFHRCGQPNTKLIYLVNYLNVGSDLEIYLNNIFNSMHLFKHPTPPTHSTFILYAYIHHIL